MGTLTPRGQFRVNYPPTRETGEPRQTLREHVKLHTDSHLSSGLGWGLWSCEAATRPTLSMFFGSLDLKRDINQGSI